MRNDDFPTIDELREKTRQSEKMEYGSDEACFLDAFSELGEFKDERPELVLLTETFSDQQLISLFLPVCHALLNGSAGKRKNEAAQKTLLECYLVLGQWGKGQIAKLEDLLGPLQRTRKLVVREVLLHKGKPRWWRILLYFQLLEMGIYSRSGVIPMMKGDYEKAEKEFLNPRS